MVDSVGVLDSNKGVYAGVLLSSQVLQLFKKYKKDIDIQTLRKWRKEKIIKSFPRRVEGVIVAWVYDGLEVKRVLDLTIPKKDRVRGGSILKEKP